MAKDIKLYKSGAEVIINESNLEHYLRLGYNIKDIKSNKSNKGKKTWQHITEKKEL